MKLIPTYAVVVQDLESGFCRIDPNTVTNDIEKAVEISRLTLKSGRLAIRTTCYPVELTIEKI